MPGSSRLYALMRSTLPATGSPDAARHITSPLCCGHAASASASAPPSLGHARTRPLRARRSRAPASRLAAAARYPSKVGRSHAPHAAVRGQSHDVTTPAHRPSAPEAKFHFGPETGTLFTNKRRTARDPTAVAPAPDASRPPRSSRKGGTGSPPRNFTSRAARRGVSVKVPPRAAVGAAAAAAHHRRPRAPTATCCRLRGTPPL